MGVVLGQWQTISDITLIILSGTRVGLPLYIVRVPPPF